MNKVLKILAIPILVSSLCVINLQSTNLNFENSIVVYATEAKDTVIQQNISKMESINSYSAEFVVDYVAPSRDYNEVVDTLNKVQELSNSICADAPDTYSKVKAIHNYVCTTVAYDHVASQNSADFNTICLKNVMETNKTICAGYSNFFSALCNAQGIYCVNIRGSAVNGDEITYQNLDSDDTVTNHEWTAVWYEEESRWIYVDCTWDSNNDVYEDGSTRNGDVSFKYFDISVEDISLDHKAKIVDYRNFFDAVNYFNTEQVTTLTSSESTETSATTYSTEDKNRSASSETTSKGKSTTTSDTVQTISTAENTSNSSRSIVTIILCCIVSLMCAISVRKKRNK